MIYGDGGQTRDFVFVEDVARANLLAADSAAAGLALNIAAGQRYSLNRSRFQFSTRSRALISSRFMSLRALGEVRHSQADISLAKKTIGYVPASDVSAKD